MLVARDSWLRSLPSGLNPRQAMFFDGIRFSLDMGGLAYNSLRETLLRASTPHTIPTELYPTAVLYAWSMVDAVNRLRDLVEGAPGVKRTPDLKVFLRKLSGFEALRHSVQHLRSEIQRFHDREEPTWGSLAWVALRQVGAQVMATSYVMVPAWLSCVRLGQLFVDGRFFRFSSPSCGCSGAVLATRRGG